MELILNSNEHKISDNCLRYYCKNNTRFINQNISLIMDICLNFCFEKRKFQVVLSQLVIMLFT